MIGRTIYYHISKLDEQKAMKILYSSNKENVMFKDYIEELLNIDIQEKIKLLKIINSENSRLTAIWLEELFNFPEYIKKQIDDTTEMHPALKKILENSIAYLNKNEIRLLYKNATVAAFNAEIFSNIRHYVPSMMKFNNAIDWMMENADKMINIKPNDFLSEKKMYERNQYISFSLSDLNVDLLRYRDFVSSSNEIKIRILDIIDSINYKKLADVITKLPSNKAIRIVFANDVELEILNKIAEIIDISKIKNSQLRLLFKIIKATNKPLVALSTLHYLWKDFEAACYNDINELKDHEEAMATAKKIEERKFKKKLKQTIKNGLDIESHGIKIKYDGTVDVYNVKKLRWSIRFPLIY
jgi:hypothetical protein